MKRLMMFLLMATFVHAEGLVLDEKGKKLLYTNLVGGAVVIGWGLWQWDYGERSMHSADEGWFGGDTENGGADKLGHAYTTYVLTRSLSTLYRGYGYNRKEAAMYGAFSSFFINAVMEVGDAFSRYGFSKEDMVMNTLGSYAGYLFESDPELDALADIRIEYLPSRAVREGDETDIITDYDGMKFLAAFKCEAMAPLAQTPLKYFEFHIGYYTRGNYSGHLERTAYIGFGLNLSRLLQSDYGAVNTLLEYYQVPYTYLPYEHDFDR